MSASNLDFSGYLESIKIHYQKWWELYTLSDATGREPLKPMEPASPFDFGLMVQMIQPAGRQQAEQQSQEEKEKIERLPVLEGMRKYALDPAVRQVLLVGRPGSGKSTALARLLLEEANGSSGRIPVLVELRYWQGSIVDLICRAFKRHGLVISTQDLDRLLLQNPLLLLFDGVNELPSEQARSQLSAFRQEHSRLAMIFTTRDISLGGDLGIEKKLEMQPLTEPQMQAFVRAYLPDSQAEAMLRQLRERLRELGQTPLLLWMLCCLFQETKQIPENLGLVFRAFTQGYERSLKQDVPIESDRDWWQPVLQQLAWVMMQGEKPTELRVAISQSEARAKIEAFLEGKVPHAADFALKCLRDLQRHHLIQAGTRDDLEFRHQLIQEYYAALALLERLPGLSDAELKCQYLNYLKWTEPLALMLALIESEPLLIRVVKLGLETDWKLGARLAGEVKPAFQQKMVDRVNQLETPKWLKIQLLGETRSESTLPALNQLIQDSDFDVRRRAIEALGKIGRPDAVAAPSKALQDSDFDVRQNEAAALGKIGRSGAVAALSKAHGDADSSVRSRAAEALSQSNHPDTVPALIQAIRDADSSVRRAAEALSQSNHPDTVPALIQAIGDANPFVRQRVAIVLGKIGHPDAVPTLIQALQDSDSSVRSRAATALGKIGHPDAVPALFQALQDSASFVRISAAEALGKIGHPDAVPVFVQALQDSDSYVRRIAAEALGKIGHPDAVPALVQTLQDLDASVRQRAATALGKIGHPDAVPVLFQALQDSASSVRISAAEALGKIGHPDAVRALVQALQDSDPYVRQRAVEALGKIGRSDAVPVFVQALQDLDASVRISAATALGKIGHPDAVPVLVQALQDSASFVRRIAAEALGKIGHPDAVRALVQALQDSDPYVRQAAAEALGKIGNPDAVPALAQALQTSFTSIRTSHTEASSFVRRIAAEALGKISHPDAVRALVQALKHSEYDCNNYVRESAEAVIRKIGHPDAIPVLVQALQDSDASVRRIAAETLGNFKSDLAAHVLPDLLKFIFEDNQAAFRALTAIQANCKFYNYEIYQQAQARREQAKQQANQAAQPNVTISSVGVLNTGSVIIKGDQVGIQQRSQNSDAVDNNK